MMPVCVVDRAWVKAKLGVVCHRTGIASVRNRLGAE
jgi:hypothetical protein